MTETQHIKCSRLDERCLRKAVLKSLAGGSARGAKPQVAERLVPMHLRADVEADEIVPGRQQFSIDRTGLSVPQR